MIPLINIPTLVERYAPFFEDVFSEEAYEHFKRYLSGLIVSENKTVEAINRLFVIDVRNQSSLNRFLTVSPYDEDKLNTHRLSLLQNYAHTRFKPKQGVLGLDDSLLTHYGKSMDHICIIWDHVEQRFVLAHNLVTLHYSDNQADYPVYCQLWLPVDVDKLEAALDEAGVKLKKEKRDDKLKDPAEWRKYLLRRWGDYQYKKPQLQQVYKSKLLIGRDLLQQFISRYPDLKLPVAMDSWFAKPDLCRIIDKESGLAYVGNVKATEQVVHAGYELQTLEAFNKQLKKEHSAQVQKGIAPKKRVFQKTVIKYKGKEEVYYTYCKNHRIKNYGKQRLLISYNRKDLSGKVRFFICNRLHWQATKLVHTSRHRWPVEVFFKEGKAEGLDKYQLRDFQAIHRHIAFVAVVYSILQIARKDITLRKQLQCQIEESLDGSIAYWRRMTQAQVFTKLVEWIFHEVKREQSLEQVLEPLLKTIAYS